MARRITAKDIDEIRLKPGDFLEEWAEQPDWSMADFGLYWFLVCSLYRHGGKIEFEPAKYAKVARTSVSAIEKSWKKVNLKFLVDNKQIRHKRVDAELRRSRRALQTAIAAGVKGAKKRWRLDNNPNSDPNSDPIDAPNADRTTERQIDRQTERQSDGREKTGGKDPPAASQFPSLSSISLRARERFGEALPVIGTRNKKAVQNFWVWLTAEVFEGRRDSQVFDVVVDWAAEARQKGDRPMAYFFDTVKRELGYKPKET